MRRKKIETKELLPPQKLETLFIDVKNKQFLLNGKEFGKRCEHISITCSPPNWRVQVIIHRAIEFTSEYNLNGNKKIRDSIAEITTVK